MRYWGARLQGYHGFLVLPDGSLALELAGMYAPIIQQDSSCLQLFKPPVKKIHGTCFSLMQWQCRTFYHWMHDVLTRFYGILEYIPKGTKWIVPFDITPDQKETLFAMGLEEKDFLYYGGPGNEHWKIESLLYAPPTTITRFDCKNALLWVKDKCLTHFKISEHSPQGSKIYISRAKAVSRRVLNEHELFDLLEPLGFKMFFLETMSLREQIALFAGASHVVAPHGAGLTNLMFSNQNTKVLELFPAEIGYQTHYWSIATALGMKYLFQCDNKNPTSSQNNDFHVQIEQLQKNLDDLMATER